MCIRDSYYTEVAFLYRVLAVVALFILATIILATTVFGKGAVSLMRESRTEMRRVVWPTRMETTQTFMVVFGAIVILCLFLWVSSTFLSPHVTNVKTVGDEQRPDAGNNSGPQHIPCERDGAKVFIALRDVLAIRADGHYSQVYTEKEKYFCVWPITEVDRRLESCGFIKVHRSYIVNSARVDRFERLKDKGLSLIHI